MRLHQIAGDEALMQATALRELLMDLFLRLKERLRPRLIRPTRWYTEDIGLAIRGI